HLEEDDAKRIDVRAAVHGGAGNLLRGHVSGRADQQPSGIDDDALQVRLSAADLRQAQIQNLPPRSSAVIFHDLYIGRLEVAVYQAAGVRFVEALAGLAQEIAGLEGSITFSWRIMLRKSWPSRYSMTR